MPREVDRLGGAVRAGAGDHRHPAPRLLDADLDDPLVLVVAQRRALAGRADRDEAVGAVLDLPVDECARKPSSSTAPSLNGVTRAVIEPLKWVMEQFLVKAWRRRSRQRDLRL